MLETQRLNEEDRWILIDARHANAAGSQLGIFCADSTYLQRFLSRQLLVVLTNLCTWFIKQYLFEVCFHCLLWVTVWKKYYAYKLLNVCFAVPYATRRSTSNSCDLPLLFCMWVWVTKVLNLLLTSGATHLKI